MDGQSRDTDKIGRNTKTEDKQSSKHRKLQKMRIMNLTKNRDLVAELCPENHYCAGHKP
jgi:hypothetical protein